MLLLLTEQQVCNILESIVVIESSGCGDFLNGIAFSRGVEQVLVDIALEDPVYLYLVEN